MRRWPPIVWPTVTLASLLILMGATGGAHPGLLAAGFGLALAAFGMSLYLVNRRWPRRPRPRQVYWAMAGLAAFYVAIGVAASAAGPAYGVAGLAAGVIPLTALCLMLATIRQKTVEEDGRLKDASGDADEDPYPGIGLDDDAPLGDTPEHASEAGEGFFHRNDQLERAHRRRVRG